MKKVNFGNIVSNIIFNSILFGTIIGFTWLIWSICRPWYSAPITVLWVIGSYGACFIFYKVASIPGFGCIPVKVMNDRRNN
jgi:hypothetical protein